MTAAAGVAARDPLGVWCGWLLVGAAILSPLLAWLSPLGFAPMVSLVGLLALPTLRMEDEDRPAAVALFAALIWAAVSTTWSPFHAGHVIGSTILKLAFQLPLYWSAVCAARRADRRLAGWALAIFAWGFTALGLLLAIEALTGGAIYRMLNPIRWDLARKNLAHATFVLALLWPLAALGAPVRLRPWLGLAMAASLGAAASIMLADAPVMALPLALLAGAAVYLWPRGGPRVFAGASVVLFLAMPAAIWAIRRSGDFVALQAGLPLSWSERLGYWSHALDWIAARPLKGWGLDASRMFGPGIQLHPHDGALQIWMELGLVGAVSAAAFWGVTLLRLERPRRSLAAAATAASLSAYLLFGAINFGVWQEWWLALGALVAMLAALHVRAEAEADLST